MRLEDPYGQVDGTTLQRLNKKINYAVALLATNPSNGGNPFLWSIVSSKRQILDKHCSTAATDARNIYWGVEFLESLSNIQCASIMKHEVYHIAFFHCDMLRACDYPRAANIAADFMVNSIIEREWNSAQNIRDTPWTEPLGKPITLEQLQLLFKEDREEIKEDLQSAYDKMIEKQKDALNNKPGPFDGLSKFPTNQAAPTPNPSTTSTPISLDPREKKEKKKRPKFTLVDPSILGRGTMDVYKEIKVWYEQLDEEMQDLLDEFATDEHKPGDMSGDEIKDQVLKAAGFSRMMSKGGPGSMPGEIEIMLSELNDPTLDLSDYLDATVKRARIDGGKKANYLRFKRRFISQEIFYPRYLVSIPQILVLLDTSGSMSDRDIADCISELSQFANKAKIVFVPTDAAPHWESATVVTSLSEFKRVKIVGRGGTVFDEFFQDYRRKLIKYGNFDSIIVATDGMVSVVPPELKPPCPVAWITTTPHAFDQAFGKPIYLLKPS